MDAGPVSDVCVRSALIPGVVALTAPSNNGPASPPVDSIAGWRLEELLGSGGLSEVWSARSEDGLQAAVKLLRDPTPDESDVRRFLREGQFLLGAVSEGLPRCLGFGSDPTPYVILEALEGRTLAALVDDQGALSADRVIAIAEALLGAVAQLHRNGIIHRDIKPTNLFLTTRGALKLLDLGLARGPFGSGTTTLGDVMGTWTYMAPEQVVGGEVDHRCDLFAIGVTLYELVSGSLPVSAQTPLEQLEAHRDGQRVPVVARVPDIPPRLARIIERLMAWDPDGRPRSASIALAMLLGRRLGPGQAQGHNRADLIGRAAALGGIEAALDARMTVVLLGGAGSGIQRIRTRAIERALARGFDIIGVRGVGRGVGMQMLDALGLQLSQYMDRTPVTVAEIHSGLARLAAEGPLLLVIERADEAGAGVVADLASLVNAVPGLAVVVTAERDPTPFDGHRVTLRPLTPSETERLAAALLGTSGCPAGLGPALHRVTNGLPGLISVAVRELVERGALWTEGLDENGRERWLLDRTVGVAPAVGLARLFGRDIARLPAPARRLLEVMAVAGQATNIEALLGVVPEERSVVVPSLLDAGLVVVEAHADGERLEVSHPGIAMLVIRQLSSSQRRQLHARLADVLADRPDAMWLEHRIRWHRAHGAVGSEAAGRLLALGEDLRLRGQLGAAADVLEAAVQTQPLPAQAAVIHLARGRCFLAMSRWMEAQTALEDARRYAQGAGVTDTAAHATVWLAEVLTIRGDSARATATVDGLLQDPMEEHPADVRVRALVTATELRRRAGNPEAAHLLIHRAIALSGRMSDTGLRMHAEAALANLLVEGGRVVEGRDILLPFADHLRFTGRAHLLVPVLYRVAVAWRRSGRVDRALEALDEAADVCRYTQRPHDRALERVGRAGVLLAVGALAAAESALLEARVEADLDAPSALRLAFRDVQLGLRMARDDNTAALAVAQLAEAEASRAGHATDAAFHLGVVGVLTADGDAIDAALAVLSVAGDRRHAARLLMAGAAVGRDKAVFSAAEQEARASGDQFLLLHALHAGGSPAHRVEARALVQQLMRHVPAAWKAHFRSRTMVSWALPAAMARSLRSG